MIEGCTFVCEAYTIEKKPMTVDSIKISLPINQTNDHPVQKKTTTLQPQPTYNDNNTHPMKYQDV